MKTLSCVFVLLDLNSLNRGRALCALCRMLSSSLFIPFTWWLVGLDFTSVTRFANILNIFLIFLKCRVKLILPFLWVYSLFPFISSCRFGSPPPSLHLSVFFWIHSLFKHGRLLRASGHEVSAHLGQPAFSVQLLPHVGHWYVYMAPSVCPAG